MEPRTVLITGARSGFGRALTREFERLGDRVIGTTRSEARAAALSLQAEERGLLTRYLPLELTRADSIEALKKLLMVSSF